MREELLLDVPHRQVVFTIPKMLRNNAIDRIIRHLKLAFAAERSSPPQAQPQLAMAAEERGEYL